MVKSIELTQGKYTIVNDEDYKHLVKYKWYARKDGNTYYAVRKQTDGSKQKNVYMHRVIMNAPKGSKVDHINNDGLDNRKENLRICNHSENMWNSRIPKNNTSGFKGVVWNKRTKKWKAKIRVNNKEIHIGSFLSKIEAAYAYDKKAHELHGEFANVNFQ